MPGITNIQIIASEDGSHTLYVPELDETYHSKQGAMQESQHVYIQHGLEVMSGRREISVLEVGFGTGLNCYLTALDSLDPSQAIYYHAIEPHPLPGEIYSNINYPKDASQRKLFSDIHRCAWGEIHDISERFRLLKTKQTLQEINLEESEYDLVYYDAFAPSKQPDMWTVEPLRKVYQSMSNEGVLVTYCAQGQFKRNLRSIGFQVDTFPGPPGKFEMVQAIK